MTKSEIIVNLINRADKTITNRLIVLFDTKLEAFQEKDRFLIKLKTLCLDLMENYK